MSERPKFMTKSTQQVRIRTFAGTNKANTSRILKEFLGKEFDGS